MCKRHIPYENVEIMNDMRKAGVSQKEIHLISGHSCATIARYTGTKMEEDNKKAEEILRRVQNRQHDRDKS